MEKLQQEVSNAFKEPTRKVYAVMLFYTEMELGISNKPNVWLNYGNLYYDNGLEALETYANTKCPASQLIDAESKEELFVKMNDMLHNFQDNKWLEENLYPYL